MYSILAMNETGISIVADENQNMFALYCGKRYSIPACYPLDGGRQLRLSSQEAVASMLGEAQQKLEEMQATKLAERENRETESHRANFADALQDAFLKTLTEKAGETLLADVMPRATEKLEAEITAKFGVLPQVHEIRIPNHDKVEVKGVLHKDFDRIINMLMDNEPIYLCGPAGTGKSFLAKQCAEALGLEYYYTNSVTDDIALKGFIDANGRYHGTQFYEAFTKGGLFLLDELDASVPEVLVLLNNALANGYFDFPTGRTQAHENFRCMAAGNTCGMGADNIYSGRYQLDAASLDRFALIFIDYDREIELNIANNDKSLVDFADKFREVVADIGVTCLCTYRAIKRLAKFSAYMDKADAIRIGLCKGLAKDDVSMIANKLSMSGNEWADALKAMVQ